MGLYRATQRTRAAMTDPLKRYALFGWDYELVSPFTQRELAWYGRFAADDGVEGILCFVCRKEPRP